MRFHLITLPFDPKTGQFQRKEWEEFCQGHKILECTAHFFVLHKQCYWTCWIAYESFQAPESLETPSNPSFKASQMQLFQALKDWRRERAHKDGIPSFMIATNAELERVVRSQPRTASGLLNLQGFGKKKVAKYSEDILSMIDKYSPKPSDNEQA